jgi:three-Cys-motif partner protein
MSRRILQNFGGDWTERKLRCVEDYLISYRQALKNQKFRTFYIDAFAGTGYRTLCNAERTEEFLFPELADDETQKFIEGSALRALKVEPPFSEYIFVEKSRDKVRTLAQLTEEYQSTRKISLINKEANVFLLDWCKTVAEFDRAVIFLDPYGMQVNWQTIECLARTEKVDMWYLFPVSAIMRLLKNDGNIDQKMKEKVNDVLGDDKWFDEAYKPSGQLSFYENNCLNKVIDPEKLNNYLIQKLKTIFCPEGVAEKPLVLKNSKNSVLFLLCFAASNRNGAKLAKRIAQHILKG